MTLPADSQARKKIPMARGLLDYFPAALAEVAWVSYIGNLKHNGNADDIHHSRGISSDHADCILRHLVQRGECDPVLLPDGAVVQVRHSAYAAWRALALLQEELESLGAPLARGARLPDNGIPTNGQPLPETTMKKALPAFLKHQKEEMKGATPKMKKAEKAETKMVKAMVKKGKK